MLTVNCKIQTQLLKLYLVVDVECLWLPLVEPQLCKGQGVQYEGPGSGVRVHDDGCILLAGRVRREAFNHKLVQSGV